MSLKPYQPHRKEFLINTDWGTDKDAVSKEEAKKRGLVVFKGRWVTKDEKKQLKDEYLAYYGIRMIGRFLIYFSLLFIAIMGLMLFSAASGRDGVSKDITSFGVFYGIIFVAGIISGIWLLKYRRWARNAATCVIVALSIFPLFLASEQAALPKIFVIGLLGLYYLHRKTARRIFSA